MRIFIIGMSICVLAISALTSAGDPTQPDGRNGGRRRDAASRAVAQVNAGQEEPAPRQSKNTSASAGDQAVSTAAAKSKRTGPITAEMEAEVGKFVSQHHRELVDVLARLKKNVPAEYERAVRELNRNRLRLQQLEGRDRYAAELELWKALSRARLLGAKVQMGNDAALQETLSQTLAQIYDLRAKLLQEDRDRAAERLKKLDEQLASLRTERDENLKKQLIALTKATPNRTKPIAANARNAKSKSSPKTPVKKSSDKTID